jgi:hypothetical protein
MTLYFEAYFRCLITCCVVTRSRDRTGGHRFGKYVDVRQKIHVTGDAELMSIFMSLLLTALHHNEENGLFPSCRFSP